jgi:hypothetical protein
MKLRITAAVETIRKNVLEYGMSWITDWTFVGPRMELAFNIFRVCKTYSFSFKGHELQLYSRNAYLGTKQTPGL